MTYEVLQLHFLTKYVRIIRLQQYLYYVAFQNTHLSFLPVPDIGDGVSMGWKNPFFGDTGE